MRKSRATSEGEEPSLFVAQAQRAFKRVARKLRAESRQPRMRLNRLKAPFGTAKFCRLRNARYLTWRDAFEVEFEDGIAFLETHAAIRKANKITIGAIPASVELEPETRSGFFVHYDNGQTAEVSWSFIHELPPKK